MKRRLRRNSAVLTAAAAGVVATVAFAVAVDAAQKRWDVGAALALQRGATSKPIVATAARSSTAAPVKPRASAVARPTPARTSASASKSSAVPRTSSASAPKTSAPKTSASVKPSATPKPSTTTAAKAASAAGPSGQLPPTGSPPGWTLAFTDNFTGTKLGKAWYRYEGVPGGDPAGQFARSHVVVNNGVAQIQGYRDPAYGNKMTTGGMSTGHGFVQKYGKYLVRMRADSGKGVSYVALLWPAEGYKWPPEIDFAEDNGEPGRKTVTSTLHWKSSAGKHAQHSLRTQVDMTKWHTVGVEWLPGKITYTVDGKAWATIKSKDVSSIPMALALQSQAWYCGDDWQRCPDKTTPKRVDTQIDWVVAYRPKK